MLLPTPMQTSSLAVAETLSSSVVLPPTAISDLHHYRSIWNIIWSCLGTMFACALVAVHPNLPQLHPPHRAFTGAWFKDVIVALRDRIAIAFIALLAPEFIFMLALRQFLRARQLEGQCLKAEEKKEARAARTKWWSGAAEVAEYVSPTSTDKSSGQEGYWAQVKDFFEPSTRGFFIIMGGFHVYESDGEKPYCFLRPEDVIELVESGEIILPSTEELKDRGKSDWFAKGLVLLQTFWFVTQCIARRIKRLAITELEIATAAYALLILLIYLCWWNKPRGVSQPIRVPKTTHTPELSTSDRRWMTLWQNLILIVFGRDLTEKKGTSNYSRVPRFYAGRPSKSHTYISNIVAILVAMLFGAVHCLAWSFSFPSHVEQTLWQDPDMRYWRSIPEIAPKAVQGINSVGPSRAIFPRSTLPPSNLTKTETRRRVADSATPWSGEFAGPFVQQTGEKSRVNRALPSLPSTALGGFSGIDL